MSQDRRTIRTRQAIRNVFIQLLQKKSLNKISVSEIANEANIGRGTFYLHYEDVYSLYEQLVTELLENLITLFHSAYPEKASNTTNNYPNNYMVLSQKLIDYIEDNASLFILLIGRDNEGELYQRLKKVFIVQVIEIERIEASDTTSLIEISFTVSGIVGVLTDWLMDGMNIPKKDLTEIISNLIQKCE